MDQLAEVVHDRHLDLLALERRGETPGGDVVAGAVAGGDDQDADHRPGPHPTLSRARWVVRLRSIHGKLGADRGRAATVVCPRVQPRRALPPGGGDGLAAAPGAPGPVPSGRPPRAVLPAGRARRDPEDARDHDRGDGPAARRADGGSLRRVRDVLQRPDHGQPPPRPDRLVPWCRPRARASAGPRRPLDLADGPRRQLGAGRPRAGPAFGAHDSRGGGGRGSPGTRTLAQARRQRHPLRAPVAPRGLADPDRGAPARRGGRAPGRPRARQSRRCADPVLRTQGAVPGRPLSSRAGRRRAGAAGLLHARRRRPLRAAGAPADDDRAGRRRGGARRLGRHARADRRREADAVVQFLRRVEPLRPVSEVVELEEAERRSRALAPTRPARISPPFTGTFIRSATLYDEYILRLTLAIFRATGLAKAAATPGTTDELVARAGFEPGRARVPVDWMLRRLSHRGILEQREVDGRSRFQVRGELPHLDPEEILEAQR